MSAVMDDETPRAAFGEALVRQTVETLAGWLVKDNSVPPGSTAGEAAEFLTLHYLFYIAAVRRGVDGLSMALANAIEIAKSLGEEA